MERSKYVDIELLFDGGESETIELEREVFAQLAVQALNEDKSVEEYIIQILQEEMERGEALKGVCPNCGDNTVGQDVVCEKCNDNRWL